MYYMCRTCLEYVHYTCVLHMYLPYMCFSYGRKANCICSDGLISSKIDRYTYIEMCVKVKRPCNESQE